MKEIITSSPMFGIFLSLFTYMIGFKIKSKFKTPFANPLLIAIVLTITTLTVFDIPFENYNQGGSIIAILLMPATAVLGLSIYRQRETLKRNFLTIICGCVTGSLVSVLCSIVFCKLWGLDDVLLISMIPRAATSPIAVEISQIMGGIPSVTTAAVIFSGIMGAVLSPVFVKVFKLKNKVAVGVAIGTSSSAIGTGKAIEMGETEGAMSGIAVGIAGLATVIIAMLV